MCKLWVNREQQSINQAHWPVWIIAMYQQNLLTRHWMSPSSSSFSLHTDDTRHLYPLKTNLLTAAAAAASPNASPTDHTTPHHSRGQWSSLASLASLSSTPSLRSRTATGMTGHHLPSVCHAREQHANAKHKAGRAVVLVQSR